MQMADDAKKSETAGISRPWIDVFASCGTVLGRILAFLDEIDLLHLEGASDKITPDLTEQQWVYLDKIDRSKAANKKWRQREEPTSAGNNGIVANSDSNHASRLRGIEFARNSFFSKKRAEEAFCYFDFDCDDASPGDIPVRRHAIRLKATKRGRIEYEQPCPMPSCWQKWVDLDGFVEGNETVVIDVFLNLTFHRDDTSEILSWRGFRKAYFQRYQGVSVKVDLDSMAKEIGWKEIKEFRDQSHDYAFTHFEVENSQQQLKFLMQRTQVTLHIAHETDETISDKDPLLLIATGGYAAPAWARRGSHMVFARNANIGRFHCRNGKQPLEEGFEDVSRSTLLRIPTSDSGDQSLGIMLKMYN